MFPTLAVGPLWVRFRLNRPWGLKDKLGGTDVMSIPFTSQIQIIKIPLTKLVTSGAPNCPFNKDPMAYLA